MSTPARPAAQRHFRPTMNVTVLDLAATHNASTAATFAGDPHRVTSARARIARRFHEANSLPLHLAIAREAVSGLYS